MHSRLEEFRRNEMEFAFGDFGSRLIVTFDNSPARSEE
jgi:hypothetical protein